MQSCIKALDVDLIYPEISFDLDLVVMDAYNCNLKRDLKKVKSETQNVTDCETTGFEQFGDTAIQHCPDTYIKLKQPASWHANTCNTWTTCNTEEMDRSGYWLDSFADEPFTPVTPVNPNFDPTERKRKSNSISLPVDVKPTKACRQWTDSPLSFATHPQTKCRKNSLLLSGDCGNYAGCECGAGISAFSEASPDNAFDKLIDAKLKEEELRAYNKSNNNAVKKKANIGQVGEFRGTRKMEVNPVKSVQKRTKTKPRQRRLKWSITELRQLWTGILECGNEWREVQKNVPTRSYHQVKDKGRRLLLTERWVTGKTKNDTENAKEVAKDIAQLVLRRLETTGRLSGGFDETMFPKGYNADLLFPEIGTD